MSIGSTRKINSTLSAQKTERRFYIADNHSQFVENIDTTNNVLVRDDSDGHKSSEQQLKQQKQNQQPNFSSSTPDISTSIEALSLSGIFELDEKVSSQQNQKVNIYTNNQSIIKDEEIERTGRNYLKHFYEKNEHIVDVDELI